MKVYSISDILPHLNPSIGYYIGVFEDTPDPILEWPHRHDFYSLVWFTKGEGFNVIDFKEYEIYPDRIFSINPKQIHNWNYSIDSCGYFILIDSPNAKQLNVDFNYPFLDLLQEDIPFIKEIFDRMLSGNNQLSGISYLLSLLRPNIAFSPTSNSVISDFKEFISENLDKNHSINQYANELGITTGLLNQTCKDETGLSAKQLQLELKITEGKRLMLYSSLNTSEIAFKLGIEDSSYFARIFKKKTGYSPTEFREKYLKNSIKS